MPAGGFGIEIAGGLVGEDERRVVGQHPGQGHTLLLADAQFARLVVQAVGQSDAPQERFGPVLALPRRPASTRGTCTFSRAVR